MKNKKTEKTEKSEGEFADVREFLARVEDPKEKKMNSRTRITAAKAAALRRKYKGIPEDYLAYLREVGWGGFRQCRFMVYEGPGTVDNFFGEDGFPGYKSKPRVVLFGDNFSGDVSGFLPDKKWAVVELWHDSGTRYRDKHAKTFGDYIRKHMGLNDPADQGSDARS
jgi:hypothetical protein